MIKCLSVDSFRLENYAIVPYRKEDIFLVMKWRNEQMSVLRQNVVLKESDQQKYYNDVVSKSFTDEKPKIILFSFLLDGECIGYGGLTNIDWNSQRSEISFLVETSRTRDNETYKKDFSAFLKLMKKVNYEALKFNRLFTETFDIRDFHISIIESSGFIKEGRMKQHVRIDERFVDSLLHGHLKEYYELEK